MTEDWRLTGQEQYLAGVTLVRKHYRAQSEEWEHDHCAFCWNKFIDPSHSPEDAAMASGDPTIQTEGYATEDDYHWICNQCF